MEHLEPGRFGLEEVGGEVRQRIRDLFLQTVVFEILRSHGWRLFSPEESLVRLISDFDLALHSYYNNGRMAGMDIAVKRIESFAILLRDFQEDLRGILNTWRSFAVRTGEELLESVNRLYLLEKKYENLRKVSGETGSISKPFSSLYKRFVLLRRSLGNVLGGLRPNQITMSAERIITGAAGIVFDPDASSKLSATMLDDLTRDGIIRTRRLPGDLFLPSQRAGFQYDFSNVKAAIKTINDVRGLMALPAYDFKELPLDPKTGKKKKLAGWVKECMIEITETSKATDVRRDVCGRTCLYLDDDPKANRPGISLDPVQIWAVSCHLTLTYEGDGFYVFEVQNAGRQNLVLLTVLCTPKRSRGSLTGYLNPLA